MFVQLNCKVDLFESKLNSALVVCFAINFKFPFLFNYLLFPFNCIYEELERIALIFEL